MGIQSLADWLIDNTDFQHLLNCVTARAAAYSLGKAITPADAVNQGNFNWPHLMYCATVLAASTRSEAQDAALRIAQHALASPDAPEATKIGSAVVLDSLANTPAIKLALKRNLLNKNYAENAPLPIKIDFIRHSLENAIVRNDDVEFSANKFQRDVWKAAKFSQWLSVSAPTSAGKSYILVEWIGEHVREKKNALIVYVVPTRALISQVFSDIREYITEQGLSDLASVSSFPDRKELREGIANIFVFTQERLHLFLLSMQTAERISAIIIDEAHKVGDRYRGVLLQQMIEWVASQSQAKFIFSSPFASNPEYLLSEAPDTAKKSSFVAEVATVNQNLIWAIQANRKPKIWDIKICRNGELFDVGTVELPYKPDTKRKRLAFLASAISQGLPGNIVYVNGADEAEAVAELIYQLSEDLPLIDDIRNLVDMCRKSVHQEFKLGKYLKRGVAFHYGNIPQIVRLEVERLFKADIIHTLVCTSTLIEGVNMSCKNIFIRGPQKGRGNPMPDEDFWNLAGRAGRWGKEFQGNIFCIDPNDESAWGAKSAPKSRHPYAMKRTTDKVLSSPNALIRYIQDGAPKLPQKDRELEYIFSYLYSVHLRIGGIENANWASRFDKSHIQEVSSAISSAVDQASIPVFIVDRNPGVSPLAMRALLDHFTLHSRALDEFIPADPDSDDAVENYSSIFELISEKLLAPSLGGHEGRSLSVSILVHQWMKGLPIPVIVTKKWKNLVSRGKKVSMPTVIRNVLDEVETVARFLAPKYIACYSDILRLSMDKCGRSELADEIVDLGTYLEFGASQRTQISLMALGFSRTAAIEISARIAADNFDEERCISFLQDNGWENETFSELVKREIRDVLKTRT